METMYAQLEKSLEGSMLSGFTAAAKGKEPSPAQKAALAAMAVSMGKVLREEMSWEKMKPLYLRIYKESLTEEEVVGLVDFYNSPAGIAYTEKMPLIFQKSMQIVQEGIPALLQRLMPEMEKAISDALAAK